MFALELLFDVVAVSGRCGLRCLLLLLLLLGPGSELALFLLSERDGGLLMVVSSFALICLAKEQLRFMLRIRAT